MSEVFYDAHVHVCITATEQKRDNEPPIVPQTIELPRSLDLGAYKVDKFADLLEAGEEAVEEWVRENPAAART